MFLNKENNEEKNNNDINNQCINEMENEVSDTTKVKTKLSLHTNVEGSTSDYQKKYLKEELAQYDLLEDGQLIFQPVYSFEEGDKTEVQIYVRNATRKTIQFNKLPVCLVSANGQVFGKQILNMTDLGAVPPYSARPYKIFLENKNIFNQELLKEQWSIDYEIDIEELGKYDVLLENLPKDISKDRYDELKSYLEVVSGETSLTPYEVGFDKNGDIYAILIIKNGSMEPLDITKVPITIKDAAGKNVLSGVYDINNLTVSPLGARVYSFVFPQDSMILHDFDLSKWTLEFVA
jgi:SLAP domain-containing protein